LVGLRQKELPHPGAAAHPRAAEIRSAAMREGASTEKAMHQR
jgi:hypothetical protein